MPVTWTQDAAYDSFNAAVDAAKRLARKSRNFHVRVRHAADKYIVEYVKVR